MIRPSPMIFGVLAAAAVAIWYLGGKENGSPEPVDRAALTVPDLTAQQQAGEALFDARCAACHGANAAGSDKGPPLVHGIYEPGHHGDMAFLLAVRQGVRAHHWRFGSMPSIDGFTDDDVTDITAYVRALRRANGIN